MTENVSGLNRFAQELGFPDYNTYNLVQINRSRCVHGEPILPDPSIPRRRSIREKIEVLKLEQRLAGIHTSFTEGTLPRIDEIKVPAVQQFIKNPDVRTEELVDYFTNDGYHPDLQIIPAAFDFYQLLRILEPEVFERSGPEGVHEENGVYFWRFKSLDLKMYGYDTEYVERISPGIYEKLKQLRPPFMKLNELIVSEQNPAAFDWRSFGAPQK